jgi:tripeptide aminopeptidase
MFDKAYKFTCVDKFLKYVKYDTQSDEEAACFPSTEKQKVLSKDLAAELKAMGLADAHMDDNGYVIATIPANTEKNVPVIAFIAHVDTSPAVSGANVSPIVHRDYQGGDIRLPNDPNQIIEVKNNPDLEIMKGYTIITTDGTTLLGADNKAGVAEIMDAANYFLTHPEIKHGTIKVCFTPDEEVGRGTEKLDLKALGAQYAYTVDGSSRGEVETETFSADGVTVKFFGKNIHPGYAKNKMINAVKVAAQFIEKLPKNELSPETTERKEGFFHPTTLNATEELAIIKFIIRDFITQNLAEKEDLLKKFAQETIAEFPGSRLEFEVKEQYRNMKEVLDRYPQVADCAIEAMKRLGVEPILSPIRGGTDGSRLSYMGLPTPNIFAGEHSFHSKLEWIAAEDMEMAVRMILEIARIWEERA